MLGIRDAAEGRQRKHTQAMSPRRRFEPVSEKHENANKAAAEYEAAHATRGQSDGHSAPSGANHNGPDGHLRSRVIKRSLVVGGHKTSVSLEDTFWVQLRSIAQKLNVHLSQLVGSIDSERQHNNLSSAIRLFVFEYCTGSLKAEGISSGTQAVLDGAKRQKAAH